MIIMTNLLIALLGIMLATNKPITTSNFIKQVTGKSVYVADVNDPVEKEFIKLLDEDDQTIADLDTQLKEEKKFDDKGAGIPDALRSIKIDQKFEAMEKKYVDFINRHPNHVRAHIAFGSFLYERGKEYEAYQQWLKARDLEPTNPAIWNNLGNYYGHNGPITNAFKCYEKAIELDPTEPLYIRNLATVIYLFRIDAMEYYNLKEQQVFDRAMELYHKALALEPNNFLIATDLAQTYYGIKPDRVKDAIKAWEYALKVANDDIERQGVLTHIVRWKIKEGNFDEARQLLNQVTNPIYNTLKTRLERNILEKEKNTKSTNKTELLQK